MLGYHYFGGDGIEGRRAVVEQKPVYLRKARRTPSSQFDQVPAFVYKASEARRGGLGAGRHRAGGAVCTHFLRYSFGLQNNVHALTENRIN